MRELPESVTLDTMVDYLWRNRTADPYRRGPVAMSTAAGQIDDNLEVIVGALSRLARR